MAPVFRLVPTYWHSMKKLTICRTYYPDGTNGNLYDDVGNFLCHTIELPWRENRVRESCIPEGTYYLEKRYSQKFSHHIHLMHVQGRSLILIHPANDASKELLGCIAPVTTLTGAGKGNTSRVQFNRIRELVYGWIDQGHDVALEIKENA